MIVKGVDFNKELVRSIDETIANLLGQSVVPAFHEHLRKFYDITDDEIPYRISTVSASLQRTFGLSFKTIEKAVAKRFYFNLNLEFAEKTGHGLLDYVEEAKTKL